MAAGESFEDTHPHQICPRHVDVQQKLSRLCVCLPRLLSHLSGRQRRTWFFLLSVQRVTRLV